MELLRESCQVAYRECCFPNTDSIKEAIDGVNIKYTIDVEADVIRVMDMNMIDLMGEMYKNTKQSDIASQKWKTVIGEAIPDCVVLKTLPDAIIPSKAHASDVGHDLTIVNPFRSISGKIQMFDTGIQLRLPFGYYAEVYPRSSLSKTGYMLANSVGIIDPSYTGNILVALIKVDETMPDLTLPFRGFQLVFRKQCMMNVMPYVPSDNDIDDMISTVRGVGGFGST